MKRFRIFIILTGSITLLLIPKPLVNACGFSVAPGEFRFWILQPDLTNEKDLTPFFFASTYLYKGGEDITNNESYPAQNIDEWVTQLRHIKSNIKAKDIDSILNATDPDTFFGSGDALAKTNSFMRFLLERPNAGYYRYIQLSKKVEELAAHPDPWEEGPVAQPNISRIIHEGQDLYRQAGSDFIRFRTAFQLMRLHSFNGNTTQVSRIYDDRIEPARTSSWIKSAALYLKAIKGDLPDGGSDRLLARVFDRGDYNRSYCLIRLRSSRIDSLVQHTPDAHERVVLQAMKAFNYPGRSLDMIRKIADAEPGYREIPFLLLREINKIEDWLITGKVTSFKPAVYNANYFWDYSDEWLNYNNSNWLADQAYAKRVNSFLKKLIDEKRSRNPALLHLYASHLSMLLGDNQTADEQLHTAEAFPNLPKNVKSQIAINRFLLKLETDGMDGAMEDQLLNLLNEPASRLGIHDPEIMKDQLILYTARKMIQKGQKAKGLMLLSRTHRALGALPISNYKNIYVKIYETAAPADYDTMIAILDRRHKTSFERFISNAKIAGPYQYYWGYDSSDALTWDRDRLIDNKASWYIRNNDLQGAYKELRRLPHSFWARKPYAEYIGGNPFYLDINRTGLYYGKKAADYDKREIVEKMLALKDTASSNPSKRAECYFQLANAWYNMTWYGNDWLMVKPWWSAQEREEDGRKIERTDFNDMYYGCTRARDLYLQAMRETRDRKLATLCCYMANLCNDNRNEYLQAVGSSRRLVRDPWLSALRKKGIDESYYNELVKECAVYQDYIRNFDREL